MDVRDLFATIGRLYAANVELTEEGERLKVRLKMAADEKKAMAEEIDLLKKANNDFVGIVADLQEKIREKEKECDDLKLKFSRPAGCDGVVDARREEDQLKKDAFFD